MHQDCAVLYVKIKDECKAFEGKYKEKYLQEEGFFDNGFIADHVGEDTKYSEPREMFWHFYHTLGNEVDDQQLVTRMERKGQPFYPAEILDMPEYIDIASDLLDINLVDKYHGDDIYISDL